jgi:hypothetical protein
VPDASISAARRFTAGVLLLAALFAVASLILGAETPRIVFFRLAAIAISGILVIRGFRWARWLLVLLTGIAAGFAALLAVVRPLPWGWRVAFLAYGVGTLWCLAGLFRAPASAYFSNRRGSHSSVDGA